MSIGRKSDDDLRFEKSPEITKAFKETDAYSELFMELVGDPEKSAEFINGIMPASLREKVGQIELPAGDAKKDPTEYTEEELLAMPDEEFYKKFGRVHKNWSPNVLRAAFQRKLAG